MDQPGDNLDDHGVLEPYHHPTLDGLRLCSCQHLDTIDENNNIITTPEYDGFSENLSITIRNFLLNAALNTTEDSRVETDSDISSSSTLSLSTNDLNQLYYDLENHSITLDENGNEVAQVDALGYISTSPPTSTYTSNESTSPPSSSSEEAELSRTTNAKTFIDVTMLDKTKPLKKRMYSIWEVYHLVYPAMKIRKAYFLNGKRI